MYTLLTGLWPFYEEDRYTPVVKLVKRRKRPFVDARWRRRSYIERKFVEIMLTMWRHEPERRPDIFTVVEFLLDVKKHAADPERAKEAEEAEESGEAEESVESGEAEEAEKVEEEGQEGEEAEVVEEN